MYKVILAAATLTLAAGTVQAQVVQNNVTGQATGDQVYSVEVIGSNGVRYGCLPNVTTNNAGQLVRQCRRLSGSVANPSAGGLNPGAIGIVGLGLAALAIGASSGTD